MMKKLILIVAAALSTFAASSQTKELDNLNKRLTKSDEAIADPKKNTQAATWLERADALMAASNAYTSKLIAGFSIEQTLTLLGERQNSIEEVEVSGAPFKKYVFDNFDIFVDENGQVGFWQTKKEFRPNALEESYKALQKAYELDPNVLSGRGYITGTNLLNQYNTDGMNQYNLGNKIQAGDLFVKTVEVNQMMGTLDTVMMYYAGVAYNEGGDYDRSLEQLQRAKSYGYDQEGVVDSYIAYIQEQKGDKEGAVATLEAAVEKYPSDNQLMTQLIGLYLETDRDPQTIISMLDAAKALDADNASLYLVEGSLWDQLGDTDKAETAFLKATEIDPRSFVGYLNAAIMQARQGDKLVEEANALDINDVAGYNALIEEAYPYYTLAIERLEKAHEIQPDEVRVVEMLKELYYRRADDDPKFEERFQYFDNLYQSMR